MSENGRARIMEQTKTTKKSRFFIRKVIKTYKIGRFMNDDVTENFIPNALALCLRVLLELPL
jgi:hypothetical protein